MQDFVAKVVGYYVKLTKIEKMLKYTNFRLTEKEVIQWIVYPQDFLNSVQKILKPWWKLILRDMSLWKYLWWFVNFVELPILNLLWYWDVKIYTKSDIQRMCEKSWLVLESFEYKKRLRLHAIIRKMVKKM